MQNIRDHTDELLRSIVVQFVKALNEFIKQIATHLVDRFRARLQYSSACSQLSCSYTMACIFGALATSTDARGSACHSETTGVSPL